MLNRKPMKDNDIAVTLVRIILQCMNEENRERVISHLAVDFPPDVQVKLYGFVKEMICLWAGDEDLSLEDAAVIEDCRKICDLMGWPANSGY